ncbi:hypothetical protein AD998_11765 [bacterium 336/3]|nr:hypothetical protein AD998_11765 [bacterium 336/3]
MVYRFSCKIACYFTIFILGYCKKLDIPSGYSSNVDISDFQRLIIRIPENYIFEIMRQNPINTFKQHHFFYRDRYTEIYISLNDLKEILQLVMSLGKHIDMTHLNQMTKHCEEKEARYTCSAFRGYAFIRLYTKNFYINYDWNCLDINSLQPNEKVYFEKLLRVIHKIQAENEVMRQNLSEINHPIHKN